MDLGPTGRATWRGAVGSARISIVVRWLHAALALSLAGCAFGTDSIVRRNADGAGVDGGTIIGCEPPCGDGESCRAGACVPDGGDGDGDGIPTEIDCDDTDAEIGAVTEALCSNGCGEGVMQCVDGVWGECDAPTECDCEPGSAPRTSPCGFCGTQRQVCTDGAWLNDGACVGAGECTAGMVESGASCGSCGTQSRTCQVDCTWGAWECSGGGECVAGTTDTRTMSCGACGEGTRTDTRTCTGSCTWGAWSTGSCATSATCAPGETDVDSRSCSGGCGMSETRTRSCNSTTCTWGTYGSWSGCGSCGPVCGNGTCESGETCSSCADCRYGHGGTASGTSCAGVPAETWRCVYSTSLGGNVSQVCRGGTWINFNFNPRNCSACVCSFSTACCQTGSSSGGC